MKTQYFFCTNIHDYCYYTVSFKIIIIKNALIKTKHNYFVVVLVVTNVL